MPTDRALRAGVAVTAALALTATALAVPAAAQEGREKPGLVILGKQAIDDDNSQIGPVLGELLNMATMNVVTKLEVSGDNVTAHRQIEGGAEKVEANAEYQLRFGVLTHFGNR